MRRALVPFLAAWLLALLVGTAWAAPASAEPAPAWASLTVTQQQALTPLQQDWSTLDRNRKQKWLAVAARFPSLPAPERQRIQQRMSDWARLTPAEREQTRQQFQEARQLPASERQARWQAYQALSAEERTTLAQRAKPAPRAASAALASANKPPRPGAGPVKRSAGASSAASTSRLPVPIALVQAKPGATTTTIATRASPPPHSKAGVARIAVTPGLVDPATLLPRRSPPGAAVRSAAASSPATNP